MDYYPFYVTPPVPPVRVRLPSPPRSSLSIGFVPLNKAPTRKVSLVDDGTPLELPPQRSATGLLHIPLPHPQQPRIHASPLQPQPLLAGHSSNNHHYQASPPPSHDYDPAPPPPPPQPLYQRPLQYAPEPCIPPLPPPPPPPRPHYQQEQQMFQPLEPRSQRPPLPYAAKIEPGYFPSQEPLEPRPPPNPFHTVGPLPFHPAYREETRGYWGREEEDIRYRRSSEHYDRNGSSHHSRRRSGSRERSRYESSGHSSTRSASRSKDDRRRSTSRGREDGPSRRGSNNNSSSSRNGNSSSCDRNSGRSNNCRSSSSGRSNNNSSSSGRCGDSGSSGRSSNSSSGRSGNSSSGRSGNSSGRSGNSSSGRSSNSSNSNRREGDFRANRSEKDSNRNEKAASDAPQKRVFSIWDKIPRRDSYYNDFDPCKLPYHPDFEPCALVLEDPVVIEKELNEVCESRDEPVSLVKLEPIAYEDPWADDNLSEGSSDEDSHAEQSESSGDNSDENSEERAAVRRAKQEVVIKRQAQKLKRETARQTRMLAWEPVLSKEEQQNVNKRTLEDCQQVACLTDLAEQGLPPNRVHWLRTISVHQRVRGYRQKNQRAKRTTKRPTGPRTQKPPEEIMRIKKEVADLIAVCRSDIPPALQMAKLRVGDDLEGETALLVPDTVPFADQGSKSEADERAREEDGIIQDFLSV